ncbi:hypothetical protein MARPO_0030s0144 [Marchantia polymorpha]|uniref:Uncharacterized protein n=1 Tax=Marchantia polymorpha TaxID=3197 RepID=A0A2R6X8K4_MARPO|nr:hypothetical protein MARPO_0030s0144 [Marchantia polymorpha]|eukprot:PTQ42428.1 hypothetical protein MARPO_0030s0144 [Marchantia polymorpha]
MDDCGEAIDDEGMELGSSRMSLAGSGAEFGWGGARRITRSSIMLRNLGQNRFAEMITLGKFGRRAFRCREEMARESRAWRSLPPYLHSAFGSSASRRRSTDKLEAGHHHQHHHHPHHRQLQSPASAPPSAAAAAAEGPPISCLRPEEKGQHVCASREESESRSEPGSRGGGGAGGPCSSVQSPVRDEFRRSEQQQQQQKTAACRLTVTLTPVAVPELHANFESSLLAPGSSVQSPVRDEFRRSEQQQQQQKTAACRLTVTLTPVAVPELHANFESSLLAPGVPNSISSPGCSLGADFPRPS